MTVRINGNGEFTGLTEITATDITATDEVTTDCLNLQGYTSGYSKIKAPDVAGDQTFTLPAVGGELATSTNAVNQDSDRLPTAWVNFAGNSNETIRNQFNVSSITRVSEGKFRVNFTTEMDDANYCALATSSNFATSIDTVTTTYFEVSTFRADLSREDSAIVCVTIFGGKS